MSYIDWLRSRVGHHKIVLTFTSVILRDGQDRILLQQRSDFDAWGLPGGVLEFGESILDCARRELFEETGLTAGDLSLAGVYSEPEFDVFYPNGDQVQQYTICLQGRVMGGNLRADGLESRAVQFFRPDELPLTQIPPWYRAMLNDLLHRPATVEAGFAPPVLQAVLLPQVDTMRSLLGGEPFIGAAVATVTLNQDGRLLVTRSPGTGEWCFPLRYLHLGENAAHAAQRAAGEEAGLRVKPQRILGIYSPPEIWAHPTYGAIQPVITVFYCPQTQDEPVMNLPAHAAWMQPAEILRLPLSPIPAGLCRAVVEHLEGVPFVR
jgi:8-oxo-dGTP pyrophosphatase MutT (NUDIX family)